MKRLLRGIGSVLFPDICLCCGAESVTRRRPVCAFCLHERFESGNAGGDEGAGDMLLPRGVILRHSMWRFDKGGALQRLLYRLKYEGLREAGIHLGECLGRDMRAGLPLARFLGKERPLLIPVPLHPRRRRLRGFNQAKAIAEGIGRVWELEMAQDAVRRRRNTPSQTGLALRERVGNLEGAFVVEKPELIRGRSVLVVDDVFTTGATTFELAGVLSRAGMHRAAIATVARA